MQPHPFHVSFLLKGDTMTYLQRYLDYYTGSNRKAIFKNFYTFIRCLRTDNYEEMRTLFTPDCIADISMHGHLEGIENIVSAWKWPGPLLQIKKILIYNFIARSHENNAIQSAYIQCIYAQEDKENVYPFIFGGHFVNAYEKVEGSWKIKHMKFDLMYEYGNNSYVKDAWTLIDYGIFYGHKPMINAELDAPWYVIPQDDEPQSDIEQIFETEFKLNFGMDCGDFELVASTFTNDVMFHMSAHRNINKYNPSQTDGDYSGKAACCNFLKSKHHKEPRLQHTDTMADIVIEGDKATAYMFRSEWNRTANRIYTKENIHSSVNTVLHCNSFRKENGIWKLTDFTYHPVLDFTSISDDCICYDDYICGGIKWSQQQNKL